MRNEFLNKRGHFQYEGSLIFKDKSGSFYYVSNEMLVIKAYRKKAKKPFINTRYKSLDRLKLVLSNTITAMNENFEIEEAQKIKEKERLQKFRENLEVGTIFNTNWGYEQTNIEFYQVVSKKGSFCELQEIRSLSKEKGYMQYEVAPSVNSFCGQKIRRKIMNGYIAITSSINAYPLEYKELETGTKVYKNLDASSYY